MAGDTQALIKEGIQVAAMMSNDYRYVPADPSANLKRFAQLHGLSFPCLTLPAKANLWVVLMGLSESLTFWASIKTVNCSTGDA
jgi:hypothetical protein